jgi:hypothetical protein
LEQAELAHDTEWFLQVVVAVGFLIAAVLVLEQQVLQRKAELQLFLTQEHLLLLQAPLAMQAVVQA